MEVPSSPGVTAFGGREKLGSHSVHKSHFQNELFLQIFGGIFASLIVIYILQVLYFRYRRRQANHNREEEVEMQQASGAVDPNLLSEIIYHPGSSNIPFQQDTCTLCLCDYDDGDELTLLNSCGHVYHNGCIAEHFSKNTTCPVCRKSVSLDHLYLWGLTINHSKFHMLIIC
ncbi:hypothetical protein FH972_012543 [Carpinus fangiana]|uniref:RING-type E3 ubiquitin transferase n=1 Tax=Carpinus fangiana TaxID=176857 RepID=A0A5N6R4Z7_9ROSI|nr:hypothetical protein FH972_012543 [Carpinus fangiana]